MFHNQIITLLKTVPINSEEDLKKYLADNNIKEADLDEILYAIDMTKIKVSYVEEIVFGGLGNGDDPPDAPVPPGYTGYIWDSTDATNPTDDNYKIVSIKVRISNIDVLSWERRMEIVRSIQEILTLGDEDDVPGGSTGGGSTGGGSTGGGSTDP